VSGTLHQEELQKRYVVAQGKEWCLTQLPEWNSSDLAPEGNGTDDTHCAHPLAVKNDGRDEKGQDKASMKIRKGKLPKAPSAQIAKGKLSDAEEARMFAMQPDVALQRLDAQLGPSPDNGQGQSLDPSARHKASVEAVLKGYGQRMRLALAEKHKAVTSQKAFALKFACRDEMEDRACEVRLEGGKAPSASPSDPSLTRQLLPLLERDIAKDSDGKQVQLCCQCGLHLGAVAYVADNGAHVHADCLAQLLLRDLKAEDKARWEAAAKRKKQLRERYEIGWSPERIPSNQLAASKLLSSESAPKGMCCIAYNEAEHSIQVKATMEPATAVNLEYLSVALQVRRKDGQEPTFSLEPVLNSDFGSRDAAMQVKRFEPEWLAGTSVGEVMFQADYHLKELSMGEHAQPVVGMRSCLDFSDAEASEKEWRAREWFVVNDCEVFLTNDDILLPYVELGVEAREQVKDDVEGLIDKLVTRPDHPLVKYAEEFTHYFDLIAERKSVIYHLRDLARATVLAKFLVEMELQMDEKWYQLAQETVVPKYLEIPQLWNEHACSEIKTKDGAIVLTSKGDGMTSMKGVYGGVTFGLDDFRFETIPMVESRASVGVTSKPSLFVPRLGRGVASVRAAAPSAQGRVLPGQYVEEQQIVPALPPTRPISAAAPPDEFAAVWPTTRAWRPPRISRGPRPPRPPRVSVGVPPLSAVGPITSIAQASLAGVDLGLEQFNLSQPVKIDASGTVLDGHESADCFQYGEEFFTYVMDDQTTVFEDEERSLLRALFNPSVSDRRSEGAKFVPPDTSLYRVKRLRELLREESAIRQERMASFISSSFDADSPGPLFPSSWKSSHVISQPLGAGSTFTLVPRPEYVASADAILEALKAAVPTFDRQAEDGTRFRIYVLGKLEIRTTQVVDGPVVVQAVFTRATS